jgi:hypothetical protein
MQRGIFDDWQYQAEPKPGVQDRVRRYLNEGLERVLRRPRLKNLRVGAMPFTSVAGQGFYGMPMLFERIDYLIDLTNGRRLAFRTRDWYRYLDPRVMTSGVPWAWIPEGIGPVLRQPKMDGTGKTPVYIFAQFPDDTTQTVRISGMYTTGHDVGFEAKLNGTTPVLAGYPEREYQITLIQLNATTRGWVYVNDLPDSTGIPPWQFVAMIVAGTLSSRHLGVRLYPTPTDAIQYEVEGQRVIPRMTRDEDEPPFAADFHEMLQCYARARMYRKEGRLQQSQTEMAEFERFALDLTAHVEYPVSYRPVAGKISAEGRGWSDLGPWYPADRHGALSD